MLSRRLCSVCGLDYNLIYHQPEIQNTCDACGVSLVSCSDDSEEAVADRLHNYHAKTEPVRRKELVVKVNGPLSIADVQSRIRERLNLPRA